jgi:hypothetical protein
MVTLFNHILDTGFPDLQLLHREVGNTCLPPKQKHDISVHTFTHDDGGTQARESEFKPITALMGDRDDAIRNGVHLDGVRHEVRTLQHLVLSHPCMPALSSHHVIACAQSGLCSLSTPLTLCRSPWQVHRHHPPLVYGRTMDGKEPDHSTGVAVCKVEKGITGQPCYGVITFEWVPRPASMLCAGLRHNDTYDGGHAFDTRMLPSFVCTACTDAC